jgi:small GTP-binding protein
MDYDKLFNIALIGDESTGKSTFLNILKNVKCDNIRPTVGADFTHYKTIIDNNKIKFHIWDLSGAPKFRSLIEVYLDKVIGVLIFFDLNNTHSFESIESWTNMINKLNKKVHFILIGNKNDLNINVQRNKVYNFTQCKNISYVEMSYKKNQQYALEILDILSKEILYQTHNQEHIETQSLRQTLLSEPKKCIIL